MFELTWKRQMSPPPASLWQWRWQWWPQQWRHHDSDKLLSLAARGLKRQSASWVLSACGHQGWNSGTSFRASNTVGALPTSSAFACSRHPISHCHVSLCERLILACYAGKVPGIPVFSCCKTLFAAKALLLNSLYISRKKSTGRKKCARPWHQSLARRLFCTFRTQSHLTNQEIRKPGTALNIPVLCYWSESWSAGGSRTQVGSGRMLFLYANLSVPGSTHVTGIAVFSCMALQHGAFEYLFLRLCLFRCSVLPLSDLIFSRALLLARSDSTSHSVMSSVQLSVHGNTPQKCDF